MESDEIKRLRPDGWIASMDIIEPAVRDHIERLELCLSHIAFLALDSLYTEIVIMHDPKWNEDVRWVFEYGRGPTLLNAIEADIRHREIE